MSDSPKRRFEGTLHAEDAARTTALDTKFSAWIEYDHGVIEAIRGVESALRLIAFLIFVIACVYGVAR